MSIRCVSWALNEAPVDEPVQVLVLVAMAERANDDGTDAYQSKATIAEKARISVRTAQRVMSQLEALGLIVRGDQSKASKLPPNRRPVVYDLKINLRRGDILSGQSRVSPQDDDLDTTPVSPQEDSGVTRTPARGDIHDTLGVTRMADNTSSNSSIFNSSLVSEVPQQAIPIDRARSRRKWKPSDAAWHTATEEIIHYLDREDLGLITARYELICHEKRKPADSAEWLKWVIEDEKKAKALFLERKKAELKKEPWHAVAE